MIIERIRSSCVLFLNLQAMSIGGGIAPAAVGGGNFEQVDDDDDDAAPAPFNSAEFEEGNAEKRVAAARHRAQIESVDVDDESPPAPFNLAEFEECNAEKRVAASRARAQIESINDDDEAPPTLSAGIIVPPRDEIQNESVQVPSSHFLNQVPLFLADGGGGGSWH